jgi:hypothetical protein
LNTQSKYPAIAALELRRSSSPWTKTCCGEPSVGTRRLGEGRKLQVGIYSDEP